MNLALDKRQIAISDLRARLLTEPPAVPLVPTRGDCDLNPGMRPTPREKLRPAAVLLPLIQREELTVLFTRRTAHLKRHAGQVSFPGGGAHENDVSLIETALRETQEETGIEPAFITIAGFLDAYETGTGYAILPVVGVVSDGFALAPCANEVAEIFEVPLLFLLDAKNRERQTGAWKGRTRSFYAYQYNGHHIWGATAAMLVNLAERLT